MKYLTLLLIVFCYVSAQKSGEKCATWQNVERLKTNILAKRTRTVTFRPTNDTSVISPRGLFRIHFDTAGTDSPVLVNSNGIPILNTGRAYVDSMAAIFDEVYAIQIERFGFQAPAGDGMQGGGNEYDIYIKNLGIGNYGYTDWDEDNILTPGKTNPQFPAFIVIDNSFEAGFYTIGLNAVRVTAAHEFHHMIEVSTSGIWYDDFYFYEMCATGLESMVYPEVKDYLQYIKTFFNNTNQWPLFNQSQKTGYERGIFAKYLMEKNGVEIMKLIWNETKNNRPVKALQNALNTISTSLEREYSEFAVWCYYTNYRADSIHYFQDGTLFPMIKNYAIDSMTTLSISRQASMKTFTTHYYRILSKQSSIDTIDFIVTNTNFNDALNENNLTYSYEIAISPIMLPEYQFVSNDVYSRFTATDITNWKSTSVIKGGIVQKTGIELFPNPFNPLLSSLLIAPQGIESSNEVMLTIISAESLDLIYSRRAEFTLYSGTQYAEWKGRDDDGNIVGSGVYVYVLTKGAKIVKGKFAIIR